jgi:hypothetical protein
MIFGSGFPLAAQTSVADVPYLAKTIGVVCALSMYGGPKSEKYSFNLEKRLLDVLHWCHMPFESMLCWAADLIE